MLIIYHFQILCFAPLIQRVHSIVGFRFRAVERSENTEGGVGAVVIWWS